MALGENGQPLWHSAQQIRETLRLRQQQMLADLFAVPQPNEAGNRLDWYAAFSGKVVTWNSASESVRAGMLSRLEEAEIALREMSHTALAASKPRHKLFGALLLKALQFPDQNCVFLVGGKPVITFWGFNAINKKIADPLDSLRSSTPDSLSASLVKENCAPPAMPAMEAKTFSGSPPQDIVRQTETPGMANTTRMTPAQLVTPQSVAVSPSENNQLGTLNQRPVSTAAEINGLTVSQTYEQAQPAGVTSSQAKKASEGQWLRYGWVSTGIALVALFGFQLRGYVTTEKTASIASLNTPAVTPDKPSQNMQAPQPDTRAPIFLPTLSTLSAASLPLNAASVARSDTPAAITVPAPATAVMPPSAARNRQIASTSTGIAKDDLVLPTNAVRLGTTTFLNGNWQAILDIKTPVTGRPPILHYQFTNGKGRVKLRQGDGAHCRVAVFAGLMRSGNLVINSRTKAKCSDGTRYAIPELTCKQDATGSAQCTARYDENTAYPITIKREGK